MDLFIGLTIVNNTIKGQEGFDRLRALSYVDTHAFMMCFSVDDRDSLDNIPNRWLEEVLEHSPKAKIILVALKCDLRDDVRISSRLNPILYEEVYIQILMISNDFMYVLTGNCY